MILDSIKRIMQLLVLLALQVLLFNHVLILGYSTPIITVALLLYVSASSSRITTLVWSFVLGFLTDMFSNTPGLSAFSMTLVAMIQPGWLKILLPKDSLEDMVPNYRTMGVWNHLRYFTLLLFIHHIVYFLLQAFSFYNLPSLGIACGISFGASWLVIACMETLRGGKKTKS